MLVLFLIQVYTSTSVLTTGLASKDEEQTFARYLSIPWVSYRQAHITFPPSAGIAPLLTHRTRVPYCAVHKARTTAEYNIPPAPLKLSPEFLLHPSTHTRFASPGQPLNPLSSYHQKTINTSTPSHPSRSTPARYDPRFIRHTLHCSFPLPRSYNPPTVLLTAGP